jgi:uncharacterized protein (TIGR03437 family)
MVDASKHVAAVGTDGLIIGIHRSAKPGETLQLYGTGFGATNPGYPDGQIPGVVPLRSNISVNVGGRVTTNVPAYLVAPGEYQVNVTVPTATPDGDATLQVNVGGVVSPVVYIPVKR